MKKVILFILGVLIISCKNNEGKILPQKQNLAEAVYSSVTIQPDSLYQVYSVVAGILDKNIVEEGDVLTRNQNVIQIINNAPRLNTENARLSLELAKENYKGSSTLLSGIEDEISSAQLKYENDSTNFFRQKNLWEQHIGSKAEYETKELNYRLSKNNLQLLKNKFNSTKNELQTAVKQAENNYKTSLIGSTDFTIKSKINGKVYALYKNPGEIVNTLEPLAAIGCENDFIIEMLVDEVDIVKISLDQNVIISLDAYEGKAFEGKVSKILPKKDERNQTFKVEAVFNKSPQILYPGLSGEANIIIASKDNVLTIPKSYLIDGNTIRTEDGIVEIVIGLENLEFIEVISGISETTYILKPER